MKSWFLVLTLVLLAACSAPADDIPRAVVIEDQVVVDQTAPFVDGEHDTQDSNRERISIPVDIQSSEFNFEGFGPGKSHVGTFNLWSGDLQYDNGMLVGGSGIIDLTSVETDSAGLDKHLKSDDFFNVEMYPQSQFSLTSIDNNVATGDLTFLGVTKTIEFPIQIAESSISADFVIDFTLFGWSYTGVNDEVRIFFTIVV